MRVEQVHKIAFGLLGFMAGFMGISAFSADARAMSREDYLAALKIADQHVQREKALRAESAGALSVSLSRELMGRFYQVGDSWDVAAVHVSSSMMRRVSDPEQLKDRADDVAIFRYEVTDVKNGETPQVTIQIRQLEERGLKAVDARVEKVVLKTTEKFDQTDKSYVYKPGVSAVRSGMSTTNPASSISNLELFPLDVPNVFSAQREAGKSMPELPGALAEIARSSSVSVQPAKSAWFEQDDFFGRPVQFLWQQGDPWPAYLKTPQGVAVLIRKGGA